MVNDSRKDKNRSKPSSCLKAFASLPPLYGPESLRVLRYSQFFQVLHSGRYCVPSHKEIKTIKTVCGVVFVAKRFVVQHFVVQRIVALAFRSPFLFFSEAMFLSIGTHSPVRAHIDCWLFISKHRRSCWGKGGRRGERLEAWESMCADGVLSCFFLLCKGTTFPAIYQQITSCLIPSTIHMYLTVL